MVGVRRCEEDEDSELCGIGAAIIGAPIVAGFASLGISLIIPGRVVRRRARRA
ncbi:MAG: hypothetical protein AAGE52_06030 [Myxococcota bacterium]